MDKNKVNIDTDWEITLPFRILEIFIFLMLASFLIQDPRHVSGFIPITFMDYLQVFGLLGLFAFFIISAYMRIKFKKTTGAFLIVDYAIIGSGGLFAGVMTTLLLIR